MARPGGNPNLKGNKNSGRKKLEEELRIYKESVKRITLEELAASKVYGHLGTIKESDRRGVKDIALPVCLKGIVDRKDITSGDKPIPILNGIISIDNSDEEDSEVKEKN